MEKKGNSLHQTIMTRMAILGENMFENNEPFFRDGKTLWINCARNWHTNIVESVEQASEGETLIVMNHTQRELALKAIRRMRPNDNIRCQIG